MVRSLRETRSLPSARRFAECRNTGTRQRGSLPSAAFGKAGPWQRPSLLSVKHSTKRDTRQRITLGKIPQATLVAPPSSFVECWPLALGKRAVFAKCCKPGTRQRGSFAECQFRHSAKYFYFQIFSVAFIQYLEAHVQIWNFSMTFWYIFLIFYVYLNFSQKSKFEP